MVSIKHNLNIMNSIDNPLVGVIFEVNNATNGYLIYSLLMMIWLVAFFVFNRKTNDIGKSAISSLHIIVLLSILLFYAGKLQGYVLIPEVLLLGLLVIEAISLAGIYYMRHSSNQ